MQIREQYEGTLMILIFGLINDSDFQRICNVGTGGRSVMNGVGVCK
jgi:hypothetical protein